MKITVCIATYNGELYIRKQLMSILSQLECTDEVIVSDDQSTDGTLDVVKSLKDKRIVIVENCDCRKGPVLNFENALKHATGDIIFLSDQDDVWMQNKVAVSCSFLKHYDLVFSNAIVVNKEGNTVRDYFYVQAPSTGLIKNLLYNSFFGATMAFKRSILDKALPFPTSLPMHDQWLGVIASYYYSVGYIAEPLIKYRRHDANASFCGEKSSNSLARKILFRINIIRALLSRII